MKYVLELLSPDLRDRLEQLPLKQEDTTEIRLRLEKPVQVLGAGREYMLRGQVIQAEDIRHILSIASRYSLYAYEEEIRQGFLTIRGGHRLGLAGQMSGESGNQVLKHISSINIRVAHEKKGCAAGIIPRMFAGNRLLHCLIVSPPGCGKTTLLRDCIRLLSDGTKERRGRRVSVADERFELSACYQGICQNDLGLRTDIMAGCAKQEALLMLLRSMNPEVLAVDEIGGAEDMQILKMASAAGCSVLATMHGSEESFFSRERNRSFVSEAGFERIFFLDDAKGPGHLYAICDGKGNRI